MVNRVRLKGYLVLAAVFLLGAVIGGAASHAYSRRRMVERFRSEAPVFAEQHRERALARRLDLSADQQSRLHTLFARQGEERHELADAMLETCGAPLRAHQAQMDAQIRALLTPEQAQRFDQLLARRSKGGPMGRRRPPGPMP